MTKLTIADKVRRRFMRRTLPGYEPGDRHVEVTRMSVPMSDGTQLVGDLLMPDRVLDGAPTLVMRTPYGRSALFRARGSMPYATRGYPVFVQSARGTFGSGGTFTPQIHEQSDGIDTIHWVRRQPWFTGRLATVGESYLGYVQWAVAGKMLRDDPDAAPEAMSLAVTMPDFGAITWDQGAFSLRNALGWTRMMSVIEKPTAMLTMIGPDRKLQKAFDVIPLAEGDAAATGSHNHWYQDWLEHEDLRDDYWAQQSHTASVPDVTVPVTMTSGWYDIFLPWQIKNYAALVEAGNLPRLTLGPWAHSTADGVATNINTTIDLLDEVFRGIPSNRPAPVRFFVTGARTWHDSASWPPAGVAEREYFLAPASRLTDHPVAGEPTRYTFDPSDPTPATGGPQLQGDGGPVDDAEHERRPDVVTFTSEPLTDSLTITGTPRARVWLRSDRASADVFVRITEVHPDGRSMSVSDAIRRIGSVGTTHADPQRSDDGAWPFEIELWPTAHRFAAGNHIRVQISSGAHPRYARNSGTGNAAAHDAELLVAHQEVLHEEERTSSVRLPVWTP